MGVPDRRVQKCAGWQAVGKRGFIASQTMLPNIDHFDCRLVPQGDVLFQLQMNLPLFFPADWTVLYNTLSITILTVNSRIALKGHECCVNGKRLYPLFFSGKTATRFSQKKERFAIEPLFMNSS
jgi:hypothetical protein